MLVFRLECLAFGADRARELQGRRKELIAAGASADVIEAEYEAAKESPPGIAAPDGSGESAPALATDGDDNW